MKVMVANRGEIAVRVLRACRELGFPTVAVYSEADRMALHTRYADEAVAIGPAPATESYLNIRALLDAAKRSGADAIHPGYGFLAESAAFAQAVEEAGLIFVGPRPETLSLTGDKLAAKRIAREAGLPVLPGSDRLVDDGDTIGMSEGLDFPLLVKAVGGGGGRGIRLVETPADLLSAITLARREAATAFGDDRVYLEPLVTEARHIEVQIVGDGRGNILCLGERECSIQRRRQKLIEESPAPWLTDEQRAYLWDMAARLGHALMYRSLGTVEFLLGPDGVFHFIEVNPRIQVEHPVTEMVTGIDLVQLQLRLAQGRGLSLQQDDVAFHGWAVEARVLAEDPFDGFIPTTGEITYLKEPGGPGIRVDSALYQGMRVTTDYDSLLAKVIAWGETRAQAVLRLRRALREFQIGGVVTDLAFLSEVVGRMPFLAGRVTTSFLDVERERAEAAVDRSLERQIVAAVALLHHRNRHDQNVGRDKSRPEGRIDAWQAAAWQEQM